MGLFLKIVGGFFLAMILLLFVLYWLIKWKIRSLGIDLGKALQALAEGAVAGAIPPMRIELEEDDDLEWEDEDKQKELVDALQQAGFQHIKDYVVDMNTMVNVRAYAHPDKYVFAAVYEVEPAGVWMDLFTKYTDGSSCTYSTGKVSGMDYPEGKEVKNLTDLDPATCIERFFAERSDGEMLPCQPEDFKERFETEHAAEMDWRAERGGPTPDEIRRASKIWGDGETPDADTIEMIQEQWRDHFNEFWQEQFRESYLESSQIDASTWEEIRDRVIFVHERMTPGQVAALFEPVIYQVAEDEEEEADEDWDDDDDDDWDADPADEKVNELKKSVKGPPREAFAEVNDTFPEKYRFVRHGEVHRPFAADAWVQADDLDY